MNNTDAATTPPSYSVFLRRHAWQTIIILLLALIVRLTYVRMGPPIAADALYRYNATANNVLDGHGFSVDLSPPYRPSEATVPLYPLLISAAYALFGHHPFAVYLLQVIIDLCTCLLVGYISFTLAAPRQKRLAAISSLFIYGTLFKYAIVWVAYLLTETLAIFLTTTVIALGLRAMAEGEPKAGWYWTAAGVVCGLAILTRPDSLLLMTGVVLFLTGRWVFKRSRRNMLHALGFCLAIILTLAPWTLRNYLTLGKFQPTASEYGFAQDAYMPTGYLRWIRTWMTNEEQMPAFHPAFFPDSALFFDPGVLPDEAFDSGAQRQRVLDLVARYNQTRRFTPAIDDQFREIANERIRFAPGRFFLLLPLRRSAYLWFQGPLAGDALRVTSRVLFLSAIIIGGLFGFAFCIPRAPAALLLSVVLARALFMAYHYATETRYLIEVYPVVIASSGAAIAFLIHYGRSRST